MDARAKPDRLIVTDRVLTPAEAKALREHVARHGLTALPFGAKVHTREA